MKNLAKIFPYLIVWCTPFVGLYFIVSFVLFKWNPLTWLAFNFTKETSTDAFLGRMLILLGIGLCITISTAWHKEKF